MSLRSYVYETKLTPSEPAASNQGYCVRLSEDGQSLFVSSTNQDSYVGAVWFYKKISNAWVIQQKIVPTGYTGQPVFGTSLAVNALMDTLIVGAVNDNSNVGASYIYTFDGATWTQKARLVGTGAAGSITSQGTSVSLNADGSTAVVGGPDDDSNLGAAWIFVRIANTWSQQGSKLFPTSGIAGPYIRVGTAVAITSDGNLAILSAPLENNNIGALFTFVRSNSVWTQASKITPTSNVGAGWFGWSLALSRDDVTLVVGSWHDNYFGAAFVLKRSANTFVQHSKLVGLPATAGDSQGTSVAVNNQGTIVAVGANGDSSYSGAVYIFIFDGSNYYQFNKIIPPNAFHKNAGFSVSMDTSGAKLAFGGPGDVQLENGAAWIYNDTAITLPPSFAPTAPTITPSRLPTFLPSQIPTKVPTVVPTFLPTNTPTQGPTILPTQLPTFVPSTVPTQQPSQLPTISPTQQPSSTPTITPTIVPTQQPSITPTQVPSKTPTQQPTIAPTVLPTTTPTNLPTITPSQKPTVVPTMTPTTMTPTQKPSFLPTQTPTILPTTQPSTTQPSVIPTNQPSSNPSSNPSQLPTVLPSLDPSQFPTVLPTSLPSLEPTITPSAQPSFKPTIVPSFEPTTDPVLPSVVPTSLPTIFPTAFPSTVPSSITPTVVSNSSGNVVGAVVGGIALIALMMVGCFYFGRSRRNNNKNGDKEFVLSEKEQMNELYDLPASKATATFWAQPDSRIRSIGSNSNSNRNSFSNNSSLTGTAKSATPLLSSNEPIDWSELSLVSNVNPVLGKGSFGTVVRATWKPKKSKLTRDVAIKVFTKSLADAVGVNFDDVVEVAYREAELVMRAEKASDHVIKLHGVAQGVINESMADFFRLQHSVLSVGLVMHFEAGGSLGQYLHGKAGTVTRKLSLSEKLALLEQLTRGLAALHDANIVHGDIKPDNILLSSPINPFLRFADFGFSQFHEGLNSASMGNSLLQQTAHTKGTPIYCAPEMLVNPFAPADKRGMVEKATRRTDMYAFGLLAWEVMTQEKPFNDIPSEMMLCTAVHEGTRPSLELLPSDTPPSVKEMIVCCWDADRSKRKSAITCFSLLSYHRHIIQKGEFDIFFSHAWVAKDFLRYVHVHLVNLKYRVWYDENDMGRDLQQSMRDGIQKSKVVLVCANQAYQKSKNCMFELTEATGMKKPIVMVAIEPNPFSWANDELQTHCEMKSKLFAELGDVAALGWSDDFGVTSEKQEKLKEAMSRVVFLLEEAGCFPSFAANH